MKQQRPKSSINQFNLNEKTVFNLTMKNYYQEYEKIKTLFQLPEQSPLTNYNTSLRKVNLLISQWNEETDFCHSFPDINFNTKNLKSMLITRTNIKEDYIKRIRRLETEYNMNECNSDEDYKYDDYGNKDKKQDNNLQKELNELKHSISECEDEYQYDFEGQNNNKSQTSNNKINEDKDEDEHYSFNDKEEIVKNSVGQSIQENTEEEEYKFDEQVNYKGDEIKNQSSNERENDQEEIEEDNLIETQNDYNKQRDEINEQSITKSDEIEEKDRNDNTNTNINNEMHNKQYQEKYLSPVHSINHSLSQTSKQNKQLSSKSFTNHFFEDTNDKVILDEFERKVFTKERNILHFDNKMLDNEDYEKKAITIQRIWKKIKLNRIINAKRLKLAVELDKSKKYVVFIYAERINTLKIINSLFVKVYCIDKMKTLFDWLSIDDLKTLEIITQNNQGLSISAFLKIKESFREIIIELLSSHNKYETKANL